MNHLDLGSVNQAQALVPATDAEVVILERPVGGIEPSQGTKCGRPNRQTGAGKKTSIEGIGIVMTVGSVQDGLRGHRYGVLPRRELYPPAHQAVGELRQEVVELSQKVRARETVIVREHQELAGRVAGAVISSICGSAVLIQAHESHGNARGRWQDARPRRGCAGIIDHDHLEFGLGIIEIAQCLNAARQQFNSIARWYDDGKPQPFIVFDEPILSSTNW